jgi:hypothetical protein
MHKMSLDAALFRIRMDGKFDHEFDYRDSDL